MDWPSYSPDLNPSENLRSILKREIYRVWTVFISKSPEKSNPGDDLFRCETRQVSGEYVWKAW